MLTPPPPLWKSQRGGGVTASEEYGTRNTFLVYDSKWRDIPQVSRCTLFMWDSLRLAPITSQDVNIVGESLS